MNVAIGWQGLYLAYVQCRCRKRRTASAQRYEMQLLDHLFATQDALSRRSYTPSTSVRFVVLRPKAREIYAADFADRVVHHWLVPRLERLYEPLFIYDVYSNRLGKGTHKAVRRLQSAMHSLYDTMNQQEHQADCPGWQRYGWYLQLDIANFFNSIDRPHLLTLLERRLAKVQCAGMIPDAEYQILVWLCGCLLTHDPTRQARYRGRIERLAQVPPHKRLGYGGVGKGLPIGNLTCQFFANVYLNELDQFIKHQLKCRYYLRYVDDMVLLAEEPDQLHTWHQQITQFLASRLQLRLRPDVRLQPVSHGINFLGYIVYPHHCLVRRRVVAHLRERLQVLQHGAWHTGPVQAVLQLTEEWLTQLQSTLASYWGHFSHANSLGLRGAIFAEFSWLALLFSVAEAQSGTLLPRWLPPPSQISGYHSQIRFFQRQFPTASLQVQRGCEWDQFSVVDVGTTKVNPDAGPWRVDHITITESGCLRGGLKRRLVRRISCYRVDNPLHHHAC